MLIEFEFDYIILIHHTINFNSFLPSPVLKHLSAVSKGTAFLLDGISFAWLLLAVSETFTLSNISTEKDGKYQ